MSTINFVKYYFYKDTVPKDEIRRNAMIAFAYRAARQQRLYPKAILIRSDFHDTTSVHGKHVKDPFGWHVTFCYKDLKQLENGMHTACHGYAKSEEDFELIKTTDLGEKPDSTLKRNGKEVWPSYMDLEEMPEIGYSHLEAL